MAITRAFLGGKGKERRPDLQLDTYPSADIQKAKKKNSIAPPRIKISSLSNSKPEIQFTPKGENVYSCYTYMSLSCNPLPFVRRERGILKF